MVTNTSLEVALEVIGMKCAGCESNVKSQLSEHNGVASVDANHSEDQVKIIFNQDITDLESIKNVIREAGFTVE